MKKILSLVISLLMVFAVIPMVLVSAEGTVAEVYKNGTLVGSYEDLTSAITAWTTAASAAGTASSSDNSTELRLLQDATCSGNLTVPKYAGYETLNLNGKTLEITGILDCQDASTRVRTFCIKDGACTVNTSVTGNWSVIARGNQSITIENVNLTMEKSSQYGALAFRAMNVMTSGTSYLTIKNSNITSNSTDGPALGFSQMNVSEGYDLKVDIQNSIINARMAVFTDDLGSTVIDEVPMNIRNTQINVTSPTAAKWKHIKIAEGDVVSATANGSAIEGAVANGMIDNTVVANMETVYIYTPSIATMNLGASIRLGDVNGIRFYTKVDTTKIDELKAVDGNKVELGTLIAPADNIEDTELSFALETGKYVDVKFNSATYYTEGDFTGIVGSLVNIQDKNITRDFVGRGYVKVTDKD
ncbi:MAG: hypothetical protein ACI39F_08595, partial [Acutalibacteraceae bacterium]